MSEKMRNRIKKMNFQRQPRTIEYVEKLEGDKYMYEFRIPQELTRQNEDEILSRITRGTQRSQYF